MVCSKRRIENDISASRNINFSVQTSHRNAQVDSIQFALGVESNEIPGNGNASAGHIDVPGGDDIQYRAQGGDEVGIGDFHVVGLQVQQLGIGDDRCLVRAVDYDAGKGVSAFVAEYLTVAVEGLYKSGLVKVTFESVVAGGQIMDQVEGLNRRAAAVEFESRMVYLAGRIFVQIHVVMLVSGVPDLLFQYRDQIQIVRIGNFRQDTPDQFIDQVLTVHVVGHSAGLILVVPCQVPRGDHVAPGDQGYLFQLSTTDALDRA